MNPVALVRESVWRELVARLAAMGTRDAVEALEALERLSPAEIDVLVQKELQG